MSVAVSFLFFSFHHAQGGWIRCNYLHGCIELDLKSIPKCLSFSHNQSTKQRGFDFAFRLSVFLNFCIFSFSYILQPKTDGSIDECIYNAGIQYTQRSQILPEPKEKNPPRDLESVAALLRR